MKIYILALGKCYVHVYTQYMYLITSVRLNVQISGIHLSEGDTIAHLSVSDATIACITRKHHIFVCTGYNVLRCDRYGSKQPQ